MNRSQSTLGILGAGQLGDFIAQEAKKLGLRVHIYAQSEKDPALVNGDQHWIAKKGKAFHPESLAPFVESCDWVTFESEFLPDKSFEFLRQLEDTEVLPSVDAMLLGSDKLRQKNLFKSLSIATSGFKTYAAETQADLALEDMKQSFKQGFVIKWPKGGYDGYGILRLNPQQFEQAEHNSRSVEFISRCFSAGHSIYAEACVEFKQELAQVATRNQEGEIIFYPLVETVQDQGICRLVRGPITQSTYVESAQKIARQISEALSIVGTFAVELFATDQGLWVNEIAPRVHNSGHCTLDSASASQFENHVRAVTGKKLVEPHPKPQPFAMINILGPKEHHGPIQFHPNNPALKLYWYNKQESRPGRKMGHLNLAPQPQVQLDQTLQQALSAVHDFEGQFCR